jgi:hypothetical protein
MANCRVCGVELTEDEEFSNIKLPVANDVMGIAKKMLSFDRILVS